MINNVSGQAECFSAPPGMSRPASQTLRSDHLCNLVKSHMFYCYFLVCKGVKNLVFLVCVGKCFVFLVGVLCWINQRCFVVQCVVKSILVLVVTLSRFIGVLYCPHLFPRLGYCCYICH